MKSSELIYLDNNATTKVDPAVVDAMLPWLSSNYGNPSSVYRIGREANTAVELARTQVAELIGCEPQEIVFTSCGSESINSAILSALAVDPDQTHVITSGVEHSATMKLGEHLARRGHEITWLAVDRDGHIDVAALADAIRDDTALVSLLWANNETGVIFPIEEIAAVCAERKVHLHMDAVQAVGKVPVDLKNAGIHYLSLSGHKLHCPKGVGALYVNRKARFAPWIRGSQENARRGGTQNVASVVGFGKAAELAKEHLDAEQIQVRAMRDRFEQAMLERVPGTAINGDRKNRLPNTSNLSFDGIESEAALILLDERGICCSAGSACSSGSVNPSHVLKAMGRSNEQARGSLRFSFGRFNSDDEVDTAIREVESAVAKLRSMIPAGGSPVLMAG
jgi:cysteine desulfurase